MRRCALVLIAVLLAAACDVSHVKPDQTVLISGRALSTTGTPLADVPVHLYKEADFGEFIVGSALALGSLGGVCLFPAAPAICHKGFETATDAKGRYRFRIKGSDTQGIAGDADTLDVVVADPDGARSAAASVTLRFEAQRGVVRLPTARLWDAGLRVAAVTEARPGFAMAWRSLGSGNASYSAQLMDRTHGSVLWTQSVTGTRTRIDARLLEDSAGLAAVTARDDLGDGVSAVYLSARVPVGAVSGAPPSRGQPCYAITGVAAKLERFRQPVCLATDGDLAAPARLTAGDRKVVTGVLVDLFTHARLVSLIVARGVAGTVVVEVSPDSHTWTRVATATGPTVAVPLPQHPLLRYIRVRSPNGLDESLLAELSVW